MSLSVARKCPLIRGVALVLALVICGGSADWGHAGGDDPDCGPVLSHSAAFDQVVPAPARAPRSDNHCYICHALRLLHSALTARRMTQSLPSESAPFGQTARVLTRREASIARAPRAPPVLL